MILGALLDLGVPARVVREGLAGLGLKGLRMRAEQVRRGPFAARYVQFVAPKAAVTERPYKEIRKLLDGSGTESELVDYDDLVKGAPRGR